MENSNVQKSTEYIFNMQKGIKSEAKCAKNYNMKNG